MFSDQQGSEELVQETWPEEFSFLVGAEGGGFQKPPPSLRLVHDSRGAFVTAGAFIVEVPPTHWG